MATRLSSVEGFPTRLSDLVRKNHHLFEVGLASAEEIAAVIGNVPSAGVCRGTIEDWWPVAFRHRAENLIMLHVLGRFYLSDVWITSCVTAISADRLRVKTKSSLYDLGRPGAGEPGVRQVLHVAHAITSWGLDEYYGLGVPHVIYW